MPGFSHQYVYDTDVIDKNKVAEDALRQAKEGKLTTVHFHEKGAPCIKGCYLQKADSERVALTIGGVI